MNNLLENSNVVSWKEYVDLADRVNEERIGSLRREMEIEHQATQLAIQKAEIATEKRFDGVNEFREALANQTATFMPRAEVEQRIETNALKNSDLADRINRMDGRGSGINQFWGWIVGGASLLLWGYSIFRPH